MRAGPISFPDVTYDAASDVLYARLSTTPPARREKTEDGDVWSYDGEDRPTGVIVMEPRSRLERDGAVYLIVPAGDRLRLQGIEAAMRSVV